GQDRHGLARLELQDDWRLLAGAAVQLRALVRLDLLGRARPGPGQRPENEDDEDELPLHGGFILQASCPALHAELPRRGWWASVAHDTIAADSARLAGSHGCAIATSPDAWDLGPQPRDPGAGFRVLGLRYSEDRPMTRVTSKSITAGHFELLIDGHKTTA